MSPTHDGLADPEGFVTPESMDSYLKRAMGGVSMIVIGAVDVNPRRSPHARYSGHRAMPPAQMPEAVNVYLAADLRKTVR